MGYEIYAFRTNIPLPNSFTLPVYLKSTEWAIGIGANLFLLSVNQIQPSKAVDPKKKKKNVQKIEENLGLHLAFFQNFSRFFVVEYLTLDD